MTRQLGSLPGCALLAEALRNAGLTQEAFELKLGVARGLVSRWLSGAGKPSLEMACRIRDLLGVPVDAWRETSDPSETDAA